MEHILDSIGSELRKHPNIMQAVVFSLVQASAWVKFQEKKSDGAIVASYAVKAKELLLSIKKLDRESPDEPHPEDGLNFFECITKCLVVSEAYIRMWILLFMDEVLHAHEEVKMVTDFLGILVP